MGHITCKSMGRVFGVVRQQLALQFHSLLFVCVCLE